MKKILIVDDEPDILSTLSWVLRSKYVVVTEQDSRKVVRLVEMEDFDLLITDLRMSNMDGWELIRRVHRIKPQLPVVAMSIYLDEAEKTKEVNGNGITWFLQKPFQHEEVEEIVERILEKQ